MFLDYSTQPDGGTSLLPVATAPAAFTALPRSGFAHLHVRDRLYLLGGHTGHSRDYGHKDFTAEFLEVDIKANTCRALANYPFPVTGLRLIDDGDCLYAFGGFHYDAAFDFSPHWAEDEISWASRSDDSVYRYSLHANRWEFVCRMPRRRSSCACFKSGRRVYLVGGWDGTQPKRNDRSGTWHSAIDVFDLDRQSFIPFDLLLLSPPRRALPAAVWNGKLVLVGGLGHTPPKAPAPHFRLVTVFDPATRTFDDTVFPPLPERLRSPGACFTGTRLVAAGGVDQDYEFHDSVWTCAPGDGAWCRSPTAVLPAKAAFTALIPLSADRVLAIGGHAPPAAGALPLAMWREMTV